ncbi:AlpA family phage regulatory protein [Methylobacterium sp. GC_Met_2]|uniref:helix-turn-helix transcriptional regulator n=1 Tax=Methylobacterium sp. GC_Met_2 TaxID=2937376 RepID=UPI00226B124A|nr:AlpA family phage regulatory protein [Methylobacterium sp. GC_Met_2]
MEQRKGLVRWPQVRERIGLSRTTVWRRVNEGTFPAPVRISAQLVAWRASDLDAWEASLQPIGTAGSRVAA